MKKLVLVLSILVSGLLPVYGNATTIEQVFTNSWSTQDNAAGWEYQGFILFDSSLGTLNKVSIYISTALSSATPGEEIKVRSNFYNSAPSPVIWLFYTQGTFSSTSLSQESYSMKKDGTITGENKWMNPLNNWIGTSDLIPAFYQDSDGPAHTFSSTTRLVYDYTPVPEPTTMLLLGLGLMGLAGVRRNIQ